MYWVNSKENWKEHIVLVKQYESSNNLDRFIYLFFYFFISSLLSVDGHPPTSQPEGKNVMLTSLFVIQIKY